MNVKIIRNVVLTAALCASAAIVAPRTAHAQGQCQMVCFENYEYCLAVTGGSSLCSEWLNNCLAGC